MSQFDQLKAEVVADMGTDRRAWRLTMIPQMIVLGVVTLILCIIAAYGLYLAVVSLQNAKDVSTLAKASQVFVGGSSSILGFVVIRLFVKLRESSSHFISEEQRFTRYFGKVKFAEDKTSLLTALDEYGKK